MPHPFYERTVPDTLIIGSWLVFTAYWFISAFFAKRSVRGQGRRFGTTAFAVELVIAALALLRLPSARTQLRWQPDFTLFWLWVAAALTLGGITLAVWARVHLGRNWSGEVTVKVRVLGRTYKENIAVLQVRSPFQMFHHEASAVHVFPLQHLVESAPERVDAQNSDDDR